MTIQQAFVRMGASIVMSTIRSMEEMVLQHIEAAAEIKIIETVSALGQILKHAAVAAAGAFASMVGIPIVGPALGDAAAADSLSTVMGFGALASARDGMISGQEQLAFIHRNEMVLPASLSKGFQSIIGSMGPGGAAGPAGAPGAAGGDGGSSSGITHNYAGDVNISAFDAKGIADMLHRNRREFTRAAAGMMRDGWRPKR